MFLEAFAAVVPVGRFGKVGLAGTFDYYLAVVTRLAGSLGASEAWDLAADGFRSLIISSRLRLSWLMRSSSVIVIFKFKFY